MKGWERKKEMGKGKRERNKNWGRKKERIKGRERHGKKDAAKGE